MANLLLVDDDVAVLHFLRSCAADIADMRVARSAVDALRLARQQRPDLILLDLHLGGSDGLTLLETLRRDDVLADIPVIFISGEADISPQIRAQDLDALDWLAKPLDAQRLRARLQAALRRGPQHALAPVAPGDGFTPDTLRGARVLAVDDDPIVLEALRLALAPEHFSLHMATNPADAAALAASTTPEVVLLDMAMPGEDGFALARRLMAMPTMTETPLIFVTQYGDIDSEVRALRLGAFDFISKPIVPTMLRARVCNALRFRRRSAQAIHCAEMHWRRAGYEQLAAIVDKSHDPIISIDTAGRIVLANRAAHRLLGGADGHGAPLAGMMLPQWISDSLPSNMLHGEPGAPSSVRLTAPDPDATAFEAFLTVVDPGGQRLVTLTFHDQTARLQAEQAARRQMTLEAEAMARKSMLSYLVHEIGNPLNAIIGLTRMMLGSSADRLAPDTWRRLSLVGESADVLHRLIQDALDLVRWQSGRFSIELAPVCVRTVVESTLESLAELAQRHRVSFGESRGDMDVWITADAQRLHQCLDNLVSNACKYGRDGGNVHVAVMASVDEVSITVSDEGQGLSADQISRLMEPFERLGQRGTNGHGLGLAVTRMLVQAMAGRLEIDSNIGEGSRFTLVLPRSRS